MPDSFWGLIWLDMKVNWILLTRYWYIWVIIMLIAVIVSFTPRWPG